MLFEGPEASWTQRVLPTYHFTQLLWKVGFGDVAADMKASVLSMVF